jgi:excisionase family DNA binding protein
MRKPAAAPAPPAPDAILDVDQVAGMLGCTARSVREAARRHELPGLKFGHDWRFPHRALVEHLNATALAVAANRPAPKAPTPVISAPVGASPALPRKRGRPRRTPPALPGGLSPAPR